MKKIKVGFVGYCPPTRFNVDEARRMIIEAFSMILAENPDTNITLVSGLCNVGSLAIAYEEAVKLGWRTVGIACEKAKEHPHFPVDEKIIVGAEWGDESTAFVSSLDMIVRVGAGKQGRRETEAVKASGRPAFEYELPVL